MRAIKLSYGHQPSAGALFPCAGSRPELHRGCVDTKRHPARPDDANPALGGGAWCHAVRPRHALGRIDPSSARSPPRFRTNAAGLLYPKGHRIGRLKTVTPLALPEFPLIL